MRGMATKTDNDIKELFETGAHYGYTRSRRHPSAKQFLFGNKDRNDIFDLEKTHAYLAAACQVVADIAGKGAQVVFVGGKHEAAAIVKRAAEHADVPFVAGRWIGGTLTNFSEIRKRIDRLEKLRGERDRGERDKYTKRERLMMDREIEELEARFGGLVSMQKLPAAVFVVDTRHEDTAVCEANQLNIPVIGLSNSDCDFSLVQFPIPANDSAIKSITHVVNAIASAYQQNFKQPAAESQKPNTKQETTNNSQ